MTGAPPQCRTNVLQRQRPPSPPPAADAGSPAPFWSAGRTATFEVPNSSPPTEPAHPRSPPTPACGAGPATAGGRPGRGGPRYRAGEEGAGGGCEKQVLQYATPRFPPWPESCWCPPPGTGIGHPERRCVRCCPVGWGTWNLDHYPIQAALGITVLLVGGVIALARDASGAGSRDPGGRPWSSSPLGRRTLAGPAGRQGGRQKHAPLRCARPRVFAREILPSQAP